MSGHQGLISDFVKQTQICHSLVSEIHTFLSYLIALCFSIQIHNGLLSYCDVLHAIRYIVNFLRVNPLHPLDILLGHAREKVFDWNFISDDTINGDDCEHARPFLIQNNLISNPWLWGKNAKLETKESFTEITLVSTELYCILIICDLPIFGEFIF